MAPVDGDVLAEVEPRPANDSRNRAQVIDGGWSLDYPSANDLIGKLTCRYSVPDNGPATTDASEFCDQPSTSASLMQPSQMTDVPAATKLWTRLDHELTRRAIWLPTVTPNEASAGSSTPWQWAGGRSGGGRSPVREGPPVCSR